MLKNKVHLEVNVEGKDFFFVCDSDSPLPNALQAAKTLVSYLYGRVKEQEDAQNAAKPAVEQPKAEG